MCPFATTLLSQHFTTMSRNNARAAVHRPFVYSTTAIHRFRLLLSFATAVHVTRASRRTCVYYCEKSYAHSLAFSLPPPHSHLSLSLSLFAFAPARGSRERRSRVCLLLHTSCVFIHSSGKTEETMNRKGKLEENNAYTITGLIHCFSEEILFLPFLLDRAFRWF